MTREAILLSDGVWHDLGVTIVLNTAPSAPFGASASPADASAAVSWSIPTSTGGAPILDYLATCSTGATQVSSGASMIFTGLTNGVAVTFTIQARNNVGMSVASSATNSVTPAAAPISTGVLRYVATTGSDTASGVQADPWKTITYALGRLGAGDTLYVRGGTYVEDVVYPIVNAGTSSAPIRVRNYPGERPVIKGLLHLGQDAHPISYWTLDGINVCWNPSGTGIDTTHMVKMGTGANWHFTNAELWGAVSYACLHINNNPTNFLVDYCYIHDNPGPHGTDSQDHCIYADPDPTGYGTITRCILTNSPFGRGVKIALPSSTTTTFVGNIAVSYSTFYNNGGPSNIQLSYTAGNNTLTRNLMQKPRNINTTNITGRNLSGTGNVASNNCGWESLATVPPSDSHLTDGGGNIMADPMYINKALSDNHAPDVLSTLDWHPGNSVAVPYGRYAP